MTGNPNPPEPGGQCILCQIVAGDVSTKKVYEDQYCIAVLDIYPANPGHVLVIPKKHYPVLPLIPHDDIARLFRVVKRVSRAQIGLLKADGTNIYVANGTAAGQRVPHVFIHVVPRKAGDGITAFKLPKNDLEEDDSKKLAEALQNKVIDLFGIGKKPRLLGAEEEEKVEHVEPEVEKPEPEAVREEETPEEQQPEEEHRMLHIPPPEDHEDDVADEEDVYEDSGEVEDDVPDEGENIDKGFNHGEPAAQEPNDSQENSDTVEGVEEHEGDAEEADVDAEPEEDKGADLDAISGLFR